MTNNTSNKMKLKKYNTSRTIPKSNRYILETETKSILLSHYIHDWLVIGTTKKNDRINYLFGRNRPLIVLIPIYLKQRTNL